MKIWKETTASGCTPPYLKTRGVLLEASYSVECQRDVMLDRNGAGKGDGLQCELAGGKGGEAVYSMRT